MIRDRDTRKKKRDSKVQEKRVARLLGGHRQPMSGCLPEAKGDVSIGGREFSDQDFLVECKRTVRLSLAVRSEWLTKITREATAAGKWPALSLEMSDSGDMIAERDWVLIPASVFQMLLNRGD